MQGQGDEKGRVVKNIGRQRERTGGRPEGKRPEVTVTRDRKRQENDPGQEIQDKSTEERDKDRETESGTYSKLIIAALALGAAQPLAVWNSGITDRIL